MPAYPKRTLLVVGDSLTVGADAFGHLSDKLASQKRWSVVRVDAAIARKIPRGIDIVKKQMSVNPGTGGFIVALGTNDLLSNDSPQEVGLRVQSLIKAAKGKPILWVNVTYAAWRKDWVTKARAFGAELNKIARQYPNFTVASWYSAFSTKSPYWSPRDGIHLSPTGYKTRAGFISSAAAAWWKKVTTPPTTTTTVPESSSSSVDIPPP